MARRNVLQEIPILVPQTEHQSYEIVSEEEGSIPYKEQISSEQRPHSRYISNDESKENITPTQFEDIFYKKKSRVKVFDSGIVDLLGDPGPSSSCHTSDPGAGDISTPGRRTEGSPDDLQPSNTPMDFSTVTVGDLGISSESFTTKCAGKSPKSLRKYRRRSTIGVRGSPEMNFLIRQIALQRSNGKSEPEPLENPFTSPRNSILREKISAFRNAFQAVEETEGKLSCPNFSEVEELQSEEGNVEATSEPPEKRKKVYDGTGPELSAVRHDPPAALCPTESSQSVTQKPVPEKTLESDGEVPGKPAELQSDETQVIQSSSRGRKRKVMFARLLSPPEAKQSPPLTLEVSSGPALKPALKKTPRRDFVHFRVGFVEENRACFSSQDSSDDEENGDLSNKPEDSLRKKRVTFGRQLSPELFDKTLPANTPLRRGSTPYNHQKFEATPSAEQSTCQSPCHPLPQPDFDDKAEEETLQPISLCFDDEPSDSDSPASPSLPDRNDESSPDAEEAALHTDDSNDRELVTSSEDLAEETGTAASSDVDLVNESFITPPEVSTAGIRKLRSSEKRKPPSSEETLENNDLKTSVSEKVKSKKTRKPVIIRKTQIKAPRGRGKKKGGKTKKSLQKPVCIEREGISKRPLLSPIPELPECVPTPPASTSLGFPPGKASRKYLVKKVRTQASAGNVNFTLAHSVEGNLEKKDIERPPLCVEDVQTQDALEDMKASNNGSPEKKEDLPGSDIVGLAPEPVRSERPQSLADKELMDQVCNQATSGLVPSSDVEKKTKTTKRRSSTRKYASHASESTHGVTSEMTLECVRQDEDVDQISYKPTASIDDPVHDAVAPSSMSIGLTDESATTSSSQLSLGKKSRRSSRIHQVSIMPSANPEQNPSAENGSSTLPSLTDHSEPSMSDFCLPIDEALQFSPQEKKVRRSMRLRRDSGVIGLSWVEEIKGSDTIGRRKSLSSLMRLEESAESSLDHIIHNPDKENLSSHHVSNIARKTRRRTLCTTTIHESLSSRDTKRRRSISAHKDPNTTATSEEAVHITLVPDV